MSIETPSSVSDVRRHDGVRIPVGSERVGAVRYEPVERDGPVPALLMYIPYRNEDFAFGRYDPLITYLAAHGYEVVAADLVGTGASSGRKPEPYTPDEGPQAAEIVEWLADREWTNGRVGMFGLSYGGLTSLKAAAENPDPLEAIVPIHAPYTGFRDRYPGGTFWLYGRNRWGSMQQALLPTPPSLRDSDGDWVEVWREHLDELREGTPFLFQFLDHESLDEYWTGKDIPVEDIEVPMFAVSGWRDYFPATTLEYFESIRAPRRLLLGPWRHQMPHRGRESAIDFRRQVVEWFDHFLKDEDNGALDHDRVEYWTERRGGGRVDTGIWRGRESWPTADDDALSFALAPDGLLESDEYRDGELEREYEPDHTVGANSTTLDVAPPVDTSPDDTRSMSFETEPLDGPVELTGTGKAILRVTPTTGDPTFVVRVVDVSPDGKGTLVTHAELGHGDFRTNAVDVRTSPESLTPGEEYELTLPLKPKSHVFEAGHRVRVCVSGAFFPLMLPPRRQGTFTLHSTPANPSRVLLPGRRLDSPVNFDGIGADSPDDTLPPEPPLVSNQSTSWDVTRHNMDDAVTVTVTGENDVDLRNVDATLTYDRRIETFVEADDPSTASANCRQELVVDDGRRTVRSVATSHTTRDMGYTTTTVSIDGETAFERTWMR